MKKISNLILLLLSFFVVEDINSQGDSQSFCFTPASSPYEGIQLSASGLGGGSNSFCLKIYVHVIRRTNGTGGQSVSEVNQALNFLDQDFNPHSIFFDWDGVIDYIDNDSYYSSPSTVIFTVNNHTDGIDIYLYDDDSGAGGRANGVGNSSEFWVSGSYWNSPFNSLVKSHVISHEMGHVLFLWHTHHGTFFEGGDPGQCAELVNGSNASTCGDYVTDTPADPHMQFNVNFPACVWTSSGTDANGDSYNPDEAQIMAYTHPDCMSYFSAGQGQRMRDAIMTLPHLINATVPCGIACDPDIIINQDVLSGDVDHQQAEFTITADNTIFSGGEAIYHAGDEVLLTNNFTALNGSAFRAYIEGCTDNFELRPDGDSDDQVFEEEEEMQTRFQAVLPTDQDFVVHPNPTRGLFNLSLKSVSTNPLHVQVFNASGKMIYQRTHNAEQANTFQIDLSQEASGIYFLRLNNGRENFSRKIFKID